MSDAPTGKTRQLFADVGNCPSGREEEPGMPAPDRRNALDHVVVVMDLQLGQPVPPIEHPEELTGSAALSLRRDAISHPFPNLASSNR